jgi:hypothetical protein
MRVAIIAPYSMLELAALSDYHLVLPQHTKERSYSKFYAEVQGWKILDNGAAEGFLYGPQTLHRMAHTYGFDEIVVSDVLGDATETISLTRQFAEHVEPERFKYMGVLQGRELKDVLKTLYYYETCEWIDSIALPRILCQLAKTQRLHLATAIQENTRFGSIHALGASSWIREHVALDGVGVRGIDTSLPIVLGLQGLSIRDDVYRSRPEDYFQTEVHRSSRTWEVIVQNVRTYLDWVGAETPEGGLPELHSP